jgi:hypothetical protein
MAAIGMADITGVAGTVAVAIRMADHG